MSLLDEKPKIATKDQVKAKWGGVPNAELFRCYLCGRKFEEGDIFRNVRPEKNSPFLTCETCDGPDVIERWNNANQELKDRFWWGIEIPFHKSEEIENNIRSIQMKTRRII